MPELSCWTSRLPLRFEPAVDKDDQKVEMLTKNFVCHEFSNTRPCAAFWASVVISFRTTRNASLNFLLSSIRPGTVKAYAPATPIHSEHDSGMTLAQPQQ